MRLVLDAAAKLPLAFRAKLVFSVAALVCSILIAAILALWIPAALVFSDHDPYASFGCLLLLAFPIAQIAMLRRAADHAWAERMRAAYNLAISQIAMVVILVGCVWL